MSCESYDWKAYALGELDRPARREAEAHADACPRCREEMAALRATLDALSTLREEEIPRRIGFVSDQIFEPRWYTRVFRSLATPNFAAACVIAGAILVHAFHGAAPDQAVVNAQIDAAVSKAVAVVEQQHAEQVDRLVQLDDRRFTQEFVSTHGIVRQ
jgi:anti-sigma factor RsiW